jgi:hypothetical protein
VKDHATMRHLPSNASMRFAGLLCLRKHFPVVRTISHVVGSARLLLNLGPLIVLDAISGVRVQRNASYRLSYFLRLSGQCHNCVHGGASRHCNNGSAMRWINLSSARSGQQMVQNKTSSCADPT